MIIYYGFIVLYTIFTTLAFCLFVCLLLLLFIPTYKLQDNVQRFV